MKFQHGIELKKKYGQHFLRNQTIADSIIKNVSLTSESSVFEIGGGDGFLTRTIFLFLNRINHGRYYQTCHIK
jgi:16S rRNA A1518/A1519 N6-dimethyltransferase RsmA/KsgA/DIM1 with predicted DNA glycosylase/AP lyase activity